jgi:hypothetical protein
LCRPGQTESAPSNLPRETAIKVRIAEFFVHHASGKRTENGKERLTVCSGISRRDFTEMHVCCCCKGRKAEDEEKRCCRASGSRLGGEVNARALSIQVLAGCQKVNIRDPNHLTLNLRHKAESQKKTAQCQRTTDPKAAKEKKHTLNNNASSFFKMSQQ